jgi:hypothetical protein
MRGSPEPLAWRSRLELLESASPIAFAEHPHPEVLQSVFQSCGRLDRSCNAYVSY